MDYRDVLYLLYQKIELCIKSMILNIFNGPL